jgi:uncharacterized membrane protein
VEITSGLPGSIREKTQRFNFIDQFRGLVVILMLLDHSSYYLNAAWLHLDSFDPLFGSWGQFAMRYLSYLCAPGFLMMNGAMVWWAYKRRIEKGIPDWKAKWHLIQRGLFLVVLQLTWVNSSWGGFSEFKPQYFGIIGCIGLSMILLTLFINTKWQVRLGIAIAIYIIHPLLLNISYDPGNAWSRALMQTFIDAGDFNKYPVLPWLAMSTLGSVMAAGWLKAWKSDRDKIKYGIIIGIGAIVLAAIIRMGRGFGNIFPFSGFGSYSFFMDQKYPPSLYHSLWFFGCVVLVISVIIAINKIAPKLLIALDIVGMVPLFFYCVHIALLGVFSKRIGLFYHEGTVLETLIGFIILFLIMLPLTKWFGSVKRRSKNYLIRMI